MINRILSIFLLLLFSNQLFSQRPNNPIETGTAIFFEIGGKWFYSANIDFPLSNSNRLGIGISPIYGDLVPTVMFYNLNGEKSRFEIGGGLGYVIILTDVDDREDFKGITLHGVIGYRYQKKNGLLFRIGFTPIVFSDKFLPFMGLSVGYSF